MRFRKVIADPFTWPTPPNYLPTDGPIIKVVIVGMSPRGRLPRAETLGPHVVIIGRQALYRDAIRLPVDGDFYILRRSQTAPQNVDALAKVVPGNRIYVVSGLMKDLAVTIARVIKREARQARAR